uniref:PH domain-containing protein n=1 Tax=Pelusios castaneus TaxID=367368 RepID=A0A8C8S8G9_9SAUR
MEGALLKWTNYLSGWQPRYFVLDGGILSYYDSQDDVGKGSKGSIKMAVCEIKVHPTDPMRIELVIPGEQYFYLKAGGPAERQKWLVALGSSKACLGDSRSQKDKDMHMSSESLGRKLSELRLYCDVLTQQALDVQESTRPQGDGSPLDIEKMNEASALLRATCSQFISTLEECMKYANARLAPELCQPSPSPLPQDFVGTKLPHSRRVRRSLSHTGIVSSNRGTEPPRSPVRPQKGAVTVLRNLEEMVMFRSQQWIQQGPAPDSPVCTITEQREEPLLTVQESPVESAGGDGQK